MEAARLSSAFSCLGREGRVRASLSPEGVPPLPCGARPSCRRRFVDTAFKPAYGRRLAAIFIGRNFTLPQNVKGGPKPSLCLISLLAQVQKYQTIIPLPRVISILFFAARFRFIHLFRALLRIFLPHGFIPCFPVYSFCFTLCACYAIIVLHCKGGAFYGVRQSQYPRG